MRGTLNQHCFFNERDLEAGSHFGVIDSVELFQQLLKKFKLFQQLLKRFQQLLKLFQHSTKGVNIQQKGSKMGISQTTVLIQVFIGGSRRGICFKRLQHYLLKLIQHSTKNSTFNKNFNSC